MLAVLTPVCIMSRCIYEVGGKRMTVLQTVVPQAESERRQMLVWAWRHLLDPVHGHMFGSRYVPMSSISISVIMTRPIVGGCPGEIPFGASWWFASDSRDLGEDVQRIRIDDLIISDVRPAVRLMDGPDTGGAFCPIREA